MGRNHQKLRENDAENDAENSVRTLSWNTHILYFSHSWPFNSINLAKKNSRESGLQQSILLQNVACLDQFYYSFEQAVKKLNRFVYKIMESLTVPKPELAYHSKSSNKAQKLPTYSG